MKSTQTTIRRHVATAGSPSPGRDRRRVPAICPPYPRAAKPATASSEQRRHEQDEIEAADPPRSQTR